MCKFLCSSMIFDYNWGITICKQDQYCLESRNVTIKTYHISIMFCILITCECVDLVVQYFRMICRTFKVGHWCCNNFVEDMYESHFYRKIYIKWLQTVFKIFSLKWCNIVRYFSKLWQGMNSVIHSMYS